MKKNKTVHDRYHTPQPEDETNERLRNSEKGGLKNKGLAKYQSGTRKKDRSIFKIW